MCADKAGKITGINKSTDVTMKRGLVSAAAVEPSLKKLPGKRKPPTLTLKRNKDQ